MLNRLRTALKFLTYGLLIGIFFAPDSGAETRRKVASWVSTGFRELFGNVTGGGAR
jgi:hypothetical protein